jgi:hypothetical protein
MVQYSNKAEFGKKFKRIIKEEIKPLFVSEGFLNKNETFVKMETDFIKYVQTENSRWNTASSFMFWFDINIFSGSFGNKRNIDLTCLLKDGDSLFCKRMGSLWNEENHAYEITPDTDLNKLSKKMQDDFTGYLFPFFNKMKNMEDVMAFLLNENTKLGRNEYSFRIALMLARSGKKEESKKYFRESVGVKEAIARTAKSFGIDL